MKTKNYKYVFVTLSGGEALSTHKEAWSMLENRDDEYRGVFKITPHGVEGINVCGNTFKDEARALKHKAIEVANRHR